MLLRGEGHWRVVGVVGAPTLGRQVKVEGVTLAVLLCLAQHGPRHCGKSIQLGTSKNTSLLSTR